MMDYKEYRTAWNNADKEYPELPLHVDLEISSVCNLKCSFCFLQNCGYTKPIPAFSDFTDTIRRIDLLSAHDIPAIKFNWRGEATLHPQFNEIAFHAFGSFTDILINTNGQYSEDKRAGLDFFNKIAFSVDSLNPETYYKIRRGNVKRLIENIKERLNTGLNDIEIRRVICPDNIHENFRQDVYNTFGRVKIVEHSVFDRAHFQPKTNPRRFCGQSNRRIIIATNGDCFPCCVDYHSNLRLGNIHKYGLYKVWNRALHLADKLQNNPPELWPTACKNCASYISYNCEERKCLNQ